MAVERQGYQQLLRGTSGPLSVTFYDAAGDVADPGTVTVTITRLDGTAIVTGGATEGDGAAARTQALTPAESASLDRLTCIWSGTVDGDAQVVTTEAEIVGELLYLVSEARAFDGGTLASKEKFPTAWIEEGRWRLLEAFQERADVAFVPRINRVTLDGRGRDRLWLPHIYVRDIRAIETRERGSTTWTAFTSSELDDVLVEAFGRITRETLGCFPIGRQNVRVTYEHGYQRPPGEITRAALAIVKNELLKASHPDRATSTVGADGTQFTLATAGTQQNPWSAYRFYGLPYVDAILKEYGETVRSAR